MASVGIGGWVIEPPRIAESGGAGDFEIRQRFGGTGGLKGRSAIGGRGFFTCSSHYPRRQVAPGTNTRPRRRNRSRIPFMVSRVKTCWSRWPAQVARPRFGVLAD